ncbi:hypothetical protein PC116_g858 [Phytophthora cactorum]|uniref:Uncharacterized protein n=1 Tax=Phytophthora cactorum TaxID=29920 RepID=A0A8T1LTU1_9STRA|nr:hypothetical protein PC114_g4391 [Phytophthora cactorum]KAG2947540.1 hypothetical protein PC117_g6742 [Phytophthora cactorum]KAG3025919.1 hypothetical protein PC120_g6183 [Phytophthora cactorum]KAG3038272.1 hypothetical protein PC119_g3008 [Phytophthora cactorum]KAG3185749.1 hypothetical protein C6341_g4260 [Phytophthora cactorum]
MATISGLRIDAFAERVTTTSVIFPVVDEPSGHS